MNCGPRHPACLIDGTADVLLGATVPERGGIPAPDINRAEGNIGRPSIAILGINNKHASWGAPKIRDKPIQQYSMIKPPAIEE